MKKYKVSPKIMTELVIDHKKKMEIDPDTRVSEGLGIMFHNLASNLVKSRNFYMKPNREDMVQEAVCECLIRIKNFDPFRISPKTGNTSTAFSFFTQIVYFNFLRQLNKVNETTTRHYDYMKDISIFELTGEDRDIFENNFEGHFNARDSYKGKFSEIINTKKEKNEHKPNSKRSTGKRKLF